MTKNYFRSNLDYLLKLREKQKNKTKRTDGEPNSREELADLLGHNVNTISNYVRGESQPNLDKLIKIVNFLDVNVDLMLFTNISQKSISGSSELNDQSILQDAKFNYGETKQDIKYNVNTKEDNLEQVLNAQKDHINTLKENIKDLKDRIKFQELIIKNNMEK